MSLWKRRIIFLSTILLSLLIGQHALPVAADVQIAPHLVRHFEVENTQIEDLAGLTYAFDDLLTIADGKFALVSLFEANLGGLAYDAPRLFAFDNVTNQLLIVEDTVLTVATSATSSATTDIDISNWGFQNPTSIAAHNNQLVILDGNRLIVGETQTGKTTRIDIAYDLDHIAIHPSNGHIYGIGGDQLLELSASGVLLVSRPFAGASVTGMTFAPSGDPTDDPTTINLFVAGQTISEYSLTRQVQPIGGGSIPAYVIQTIDTSVFVPPSPDPAGITYLPTTGELLMSDSEVDETPLFVGTNLYHVTLGGTLAMTGTTTAISTEPTGVTVNPSNDRIFYVDDNADRLYEIDAGGDGQIGTGDDTVSTINIQNMGITDAEGVAYNTLNGHLYIVDGLGLEVYDLDPGPNGVFEGTPPAGDDVLTSFDISGILAVNEPSGIAFNEDDNTIFVVDAADAIFEFSTSGTELATIDISVASALHPNGVVYAPSSIDPSEKSFYVAERGVDNGVDPNENDGKIFELSIVNSGPIVDAGMKQVVAENEAATLDGTVSDDGLPVPPGNITLMWSKMSGPGTVTFGDDTAEDTTATFSAPGTYFLKLDADDGEITNSDTVRVDVIPLSEIITEDTVVAMFSDDAEETSSQVMQLNSPDLDLASKAVGIRFANVDVPEDAVIVKAYIQFTADKINTATANMTITGHDANNSSTFNTNNGNITNRNMTSASIDWTPANWDMVGDAGIAQQTPDLEAIVQEIINRGGWVQNNAITILFSRNVGERAGVATEGEPTEAPVLHIEYTLGGAPTATTLQDTDVATTNTLPMALLISLLGLLTVLTALRHAASKKR